MYSCFVFLLYLALAAIQRINTEGGVQLANVSYQLLPRFEPEAPEALGDLQNVSVVIGGWTTETRQLLLPFVEPSSALLLDAGRYEGQECSDTVLYFGGVPNQFLAPALKFVQQDLTQFGTRFFLLGEDNSFAQTLFEMAHWTLTLFPSVIVGEWRGGGNNDFTSLFSLLEDVTKTGTTLTILNAMTTEKSAIFFQFLVLFLFLILYASSCTIDLLLLFMFD